MNRFISILILVSCSLGPSALSRTAAPQPELSADEPISYSADEGLLTALGNAVYEDERVRVEADRIDYNRRLNQVQAKGNVRVTRQGFRLVTHSMTYDAGKRHMVTGPYRAAYPPIYIEGDGFEGNPDQIDFSGSRIYYREPLPGSPSVAALSATWLPGNSISGEGIQFSPFRGLQVPLPSLDYEFGAPTLSATGELGFKSSVGAFARGEFLYPVDPHWGVGANIGLYSRRGLMIGPTLAFHRREGDRHTDLFLRSGYISDQGGEGRLGEDRRGQAIDKDRGLIEWGLQHRQESFDLTAKGTYISDSEIMRDFHSRDYYRDTEPDHFLEARYHWNHWILTAFYRQSLNTAYNLTERLPELRIDRLPREIGQTGIYQDIALGYGRYRKVRIDDGFTPISLPSMPWSLQDQDLDPDGWWDRVDGWYHVERPMRIAGTLDFTPLATARWTHYASSWPQQTRSSESIDRVMGEVGFDLSMQGEAFFEYSNRIWRIDGVRHLSRPLIQYRYLPGGSYAANRIPALDTFTYSPLKPTLDLTQLRHVDQLDDLNLMRFGWENRIQTRDRDGLPRDLAEFHLYQDLVFSRAPGEPSWDAFYLEGRLFPARWMDLGFEQKYRPESQQLEASRLLLSLYSGDAWRARVTADYLRGSIKLYGLDLDYQLTPEYLLGASIRYNARTESFTRQRYAIRRSFGRVWELEVYFSLHSGDIRESRTSFGLGIHLLNF
ncbi:MAG: hypothetical protein JJU20_11530 [Opitutales bacterium]|nr:hypothetical protein [Opitutales bacterium]